MPMTDGPNTQLRELISHLTLAGIPIRLMASSSISTEPGHRGKFAIWLNDHRFGSYNTYETIAFCEGLRMGLVGVKGLCARPLVAGTPVI